MPLVRPLVKCTIKWRERERAMLLRSPLFGGKTRVTFSLPAADLAGVVSVVGDFNGWQPGQHELKARRNGTRSVSVALAPGS